MQMPDWDRLPANVREDIRRSAHNVLCDITLERLAAQFSEDEFRTLERGANGEPVELPELTRLLRKFSDALSAQTDLMSAFFDRLTALGCPSDTPIGEFCARHNIPIPPGMPDIVTLPARGKRA
jgi:hypothetical protein